MAVVSNSRSKPLIASSFRQYPRLLDVSLRKERAEERERERVEAGPRMRERKSNEKICMYIYTSTPRREFSLENFPFFYS